jgi:hypothetical protein
VISHPRLPEPSAAVGVSHAAVGVLECWCLTPQAFKLKGLLSGMICGPQASVDLDQAWIWIKRGSVCEVMALLSQQSA